MGSPCPATHRYGRTIDHPIFIKYSHRDPAKLISEFSVRRSSSLDTNLPLCVLILFPYEMVRSQIGKSMRSCGILSPTHTLSVGIENAHCSVITDKVLRGMELI